MFNANKITAWPFDVLLSASRRYGRHRTSMEPRDGTLRLRGSRSRLLPRRTCDPPLGRNVCGIPHGPRGPCLLLDGSLAGEATAGSPTRPEGACSSGSTRSAGRGSRIDKPRQRRDQDAPSLPREPRQGNPAAGLDPARLVARRCRPVLRRAHRASTDGSPTGNQPARRASRPASSTG